MPLAAGTRLGSYEIVSALGAGGMGEVYRARDLKLKRDVALKVTPDEFARDAERLVRFQREAEILASLNHPHIAAIHDLAEADGTRCLILELVEGQTLADLIRRGPIPLDDTCRIATEIAEALEAAHEKGITHRDLKPANIMLGEGEHNAASRSLTSGWRSSRRCRPARPAPPRCRRPRSPGKGASSAR